MIQTHAYKWLYPGPRIEKCNNTVLYYHREYNFASKIRASTVFIKSYKQSCQYMYSTVTELNDDQLIY